MKNRDEYLKILQELVDQQYNDTNTQDIEQEDTWIYAESPLLEKIKKSKPNYHGVIDVTNFKRHKIRDALYDYMQFRVGEFLIKIITYQGESNKKLADDAKTTVNVSLWEKKFTTPSGNPCNMDFKLNILKDNRFHGKPWLLLFNSSGSGYNIPITTMIDIIRWMQAIQKLTAFL